MLGRTQPGAPEQTPGSPAPALAAQACGSVLESLPLPEIRSRTWNAMRTKTDRAGAGTRLQPAAPMQPCTCRGWSITSIHSSLRPPHLRHPLPARPPLPWRVGAPPVRPPQGTLAGTTGETSCLGQRGLCPPTVITNVQFGIASSLLQPPGTWRPPVALEARAATAPPALGSAPSRQAPGGRGTSTQQAGEQEPTHRSPALQPPRTPWCNGSWDKIPQGEQERLPGSRPAFPGCLQSYTLRESQGWCPGAKPWDKARKQSSESGHCGAGEPQERFSKGGAGEGGASQGLASLHEKIHLCTKGNKPKTAPSQGGFVLLKGNSCCAPAFQMPWSKNPPPSKQRGAPALCRAQKQTNHHQGFLRLGLVFLFFFLTPHSGT